jgi:protein dispatched 1|tara:strand:- start:337 stop:687 length:351 start_codon:yes stop_codon:yes gene_type:complete
VTYFGTLQVVAIFLVIGIAADDIFVFIDAWKQSNFVGKEVIQGDIKKRMAYAFRRGVRAMTVTSSTTAVAFFANAFSPIMPIRSFGIFTGVLIPINFLLVVMIMPPAVIYYEFNIK